MQIIPILIFVIMVLDFTEIRVPIIRNCVARRDRIHGDTVEMGFPFFDRFLMDMKREIMAISTWESGNSFKEHASMLLVVACLVPSLVHATLHDDALHHQLVHDGAELSVP